MLLKPTTGMVQAIRLVKLVPKAHAESVPAFQHTLHTIYTVSQAKGKNGLILWVLWRPSFTSNSCFELDTHDAQHGKC